MSHTLCQLCIINHPSSYNYRQIYYSGKLTLLHFCDLLETCHDQEGCLFALISLQRTVNRHYYKSILISLVPRPHLSLEEKSNFGDFRPKAWSSWRFMEESMHLCYLCLFPYQCMQCVCVCESVCVCAKYITQQCPTVMQQLIVCISKTTRKLTRLALFLARGGVWDNITIYSFFSHPINVYSRTLTHNPNGDSALLGIIVYQWGR